MTSSAESSQSFDAVILAGGRGSRLGGRDKATIELSGERLVDRAVAAARAAGALRIIVVGSPEAGALADVVVREDPPFSGPLAALQAALPEVVAPWFSLLSCDLRSPAWVMEQLRTARTATTADGVILIDEEGHRQWLAACYRTNAVRARLREMPEGAGGSLRSVLGRLRLQEIEALPGSCDDIDTVEELARARADSRKAPK